ncbi:hypothetical protein KGQ20_02255 [Catenulispora sp. NF23]|uniref:Uncharacterized protein n=1 Tax=Catenulispora pinistramenti TaxID=2705254 RepID=A0ABS5KIE9_9ACTN|nr:hypothetical protein [Catenulispora pinistramenti]MBS2531588.1 hypothetical protein [Catenulispora pinistramenti]MBS2546162.1 hypothetical protein [Catenulispora pinistramenti]
MITDANVGQFLTERHPDFAPLYQAHLNDWGTDPSTRYVLLRTFAEEFMTPRLRTGSPEERARLFDTVEQLLADSDSLIDDAVDHQIIGELIDAGYTLKENPVDLTGAGPATTERINRTRNWRPTKP